MSKAFTKEDDASEAPLVIPQRAPLPEGVTNYVTKSGLTALRAELEDLLAERTRVETSADETDRPRLLATLLARIAELEARLGSAVFVDPAEQARDEVRFGATVTVRADDGKTETAERTYRIVGVDEANAAAGRIAFVAPLARALLGKQVGDVTTLRTPRGEEELEILKIDYAAN